MIKRTVAVVFLLSFAFCLPLTAEEMPSTDGVSEAPIANLQDYVIAPSDLIRFQVYQEEDLAREVRVSQGGNITLPLVGTVEVKGKTVGQAQEHLTDLYNRDFLVDPQINLSIMEYSQRRVNVLGHVNRPGLVVFPPEESMTLIDAISGAGGFQRGANTRRVILIRTNEDGTRDRYTIDVEDIIQGNANYVWELQRDDVINVPQRVL